MRPSEPSKAIPEIISGFYSTYRLDIRPGRTEVYVYIYYIYIYIYINNNNNNKNVRAYGRYFLKRESPFYPVRHVTLRRKIERKRQIASTRFPHRLKSANYVWLACETRAKIALSEPDTSLTTTLLLSLRRPRWLYGNHQSSQFVSKFLETTGAIGTIIWKPGFNNTGIQITPGKSYIWWHSSEICGLTSLERRATIKSLNTDVEII